MYIIAILNLIFFKSQGPSQNLRIIDGQAYTYSLFFHSLPLYIVQNMRRALNFHEEDYIRYLLVCCIHVVSFYMKSELLKISRNKSTNL